MNMKPYLVLQVISVIVLAIGPSAAVKNTGRQSRTFTTGKRRHHKTSKDQLLVKTVWPIRIDFNGRHFDGPSHNFRLREEEKWSRHVRYTFRTFGPTPTTGQKLTLDLSMDTKLSVPQFLVQSVRESLEQNRTWIKMFDPIKSGLNCLYTGRVMGDPRSKVVVSLCNGMMGQIHTSNGEFSISPLSHDRKSSSLIPHKLTRLKLSRYSHANDIMDHYHFRPLHLHYETQRTKDQLPQINRHKGRYLSPDQQATMQKYSRRKWAARRRRRKRSVSVEQHIEVMVVADSLMAQYYGNDLQLYILTLMSIVALIYHDASIGNLMNIAVVKLLVMDQYENEEILKSQNVSTILKKFCRWQQSHNIADDSHPYHHDTAILITRTDICLETPPISKCEILGLAEVGKVCDHTKSCSVVEDTGLSTAFTIAHELGHVLNIPHDGEKACDKYNKNSTISNIMAAVMGEESDPWSWSKCSRHFLTEFLDSDHGKCILDKPISVMNKKQHQHLQYQPGELYNASKQCELLYTSGYKPCYDIITQRPCQMLWCEGPNHGEGCLSKHSPWADGTDCGLNMWCQRGECVKKNYRALIPVNGNWGEWSAYSTCSRSCGGGIAQSERQCNNPRPANGGRYCLGRRMRYKSCNAKDCLAGAKNFRDSQCEVFNGVNFDLKDIPAHPKWVPKFYTEVPEKDSCRLICSVNGTSMYHVLKDKVTDGTPCRPDSYDICVNGNCVKAGCDHILGSNTKADMCNVCQGNNSTCRVVSGSFNASRYGYNLVKVIPAGAANLRIRQKGYRGLSKDDNYLVLRTDEGYLLNGDFVLQSFELKLYYGGVEIEYSGSNTTVEELTTKRRLQKDLYLEVLTVGHLYPPDIRYQYTVPLEDDDEYVWHLEDHWSECTKVCKGEQYRRVVCIRIYDRVLVSEDHCRYQTKPDSMANVCNLHCSLKWHIIEESECSSRCSVGTKQRTVKCFQEIDEGEKHPLHDRYCEEEEPKPPEVAECVGDCAEVFWNLGEWSECSQSCGGGVQSRSASCMDSNNRVLHDKECKSSLKQTVRLCNSRSCPRWEFGDWTPCSVTCGRGRRHRPYWCQQDNQVVSEAYCDESSLPASNEECLVRECTMWEPSNWGPCSVSCGEGHTQRTIRCISESGEELGASYCDYSKRPNDMMECDLPGCVTSMTSTESTTSMHGSYNSTNFYPSTVEVVGKGKVRPPPSRSRVDDKYRVAQRFVPIWKTGSWTECSRPCGEGTRERYVACHDEGTGKRFPDDMCGASKKPLSHEKCRDRSCGYWRTGEWSKCSKSCGGGYKQRQVKCLNLHQTESELCDPEKRPTGTIRCNVEACPLWKTTSWSDCSATCGKGMSIRETMCQSPIGQTLSHHYCDQNTKPELTKNCHSTKACVEAKTYFWQKTPWSECSITCGKGTRQRAVTCAVKGSKTEISDEFCTKKKPRSTKRCRRGSCPKWRRSKWSKCSFLCNGTQVRSAECRHKRRVVDMALCGGKARQPSIEKRVCNVKKKCVYRWRSKSWSQCSKPCGTGLIHRIVLCVDADGQPVPEKLCKRRKPRSKGRCNTHSCDYTWKTESWSACTHSCDVGIQTRDVTCHRVNPYGWIIPRPVLHNKCNQSTRPQSVRRCNYGSCLYQNSPSSNQKHQGVWKVGRWRTCSTVCGRGISRRRVRCYSHFGKKLPRKYCNSRLRPARKQTCWLRPCAMMNCKDVQQRLYNHRDGEYYLFVHGTKVKIYCAGMNTSSPREYISLVSGQTENFSEIYSKRLLQPKSCPANGQRDENCLCHNDYKFRAGFTTYSKIRINVTTLEIKTNDFTFSETRGMKNIRYGEAGDCYSAAKCPQGRFSINLFHTNFVVWSDVRWKVNGAYPSIKIHRTNDGLKVQGKCGGFCGSCFPNPSKGGLILDVAPP